MRMPSAPGCGRASALSTPFARVTGISSLSGFTATSARTSGLIALTSASSTVARTASTSTRPITVLAAIMPG